MEKFTLKMMINWNSVLILAVFICVFIVPVFPPAWGRTPVRLVFTLIFLSGVLSMEKRKIHILYLSLAAFALEWISGILDWKMIAEISRALNVLFFLFVMVSLVRQMATPKVINYQVIVAAITGYLLLGVIYSLVIAAIVQRDPGAFNMTIITDGSSESGAHLSEPLYFGFVTMATLGYGDILPLKPYTRSLAAFITISGQLYIATIIGILIGKMASKTENQ